MASLLLSGTVWLVGLAVARSDLRCVMCPTALPRTALNAGALNGKDYPGKGPVELPGVWN